MSNQAVIKIAEQTSRAGAFTMPLRAARLKDLARVGGKAAHLGELIAAGLPVPSGFVVTTDAYERFMKYDPRIRDWLERCEQSGRGDPAALRTAAQELSQLLSAIPVPGDVAEAIVAAMAPEPGGARAVRSSATAEDLPEASFAGQHDSFLNVRGCDEVVAAVKRCWLSLFSERAISYRLRKGVAPGRAQMAVIVQELVDADAAGVMFTTNPAGGASDSIFIEAAFGLGEAVVQGKVAPDRVEVSRSRLRVVRRQTGLKRVQMVAGKNGVLEELLPAAKANAPVLDDETVTRLAYLGLKAERLLGVPLDIEWGLSRRDLWLFQARPVTTQSRNGKLKGTSFEERQVWTNANTGEVLPDVMTPMTWSLLRRIGRELFNRFLWQVGIRIREEQLVGMIAGRAYFNFNTFCALGRGVPGLKNLRIEDLMGGKQDTMLALKQIKISQADLPRIEAHRWRTAVGLPMLVLKFLFCSTQRGERAVASVRRTNLDLAAIGPEQLTDAKLLKAVQLSSTLELLRDAKALEAFGFGLGYMAVLFALCEKWFGPEGRSTGNRLLAGVGDLDSAETGYELWRLAEQAASGPEIKGVLLSEHTFAGVAARLEGCESGRAFLAQWNSFMHRHGHHTRGEVELFNPRWSECPDFVLDLVRGYVEAIDAGHPSPVARQDALANERLLFAKKCLDRLRNPLKRAIFGRVLSRAQKGGWFRENLKSEAIRQFALLRRLLLELGRRLAARGRLADENDVFFLESEELQSGCLWDRATDLRTRVAGRRAAYERDLKVTPPAVVVGRFDPDSFVPGAVDRETKVFYGLGVSAGVARGRARVVLRSDADERVRPGEILVAPFTDPGWTPYFVAAAGIVMDLGGLLSHGSIVAREYGIPAVVNVGPATQIIRTGQWLEVDADRGVVKLLDEEQQGRPPKN
ncbi:putative Pyruvate phosphate dikinase PEP/pyruvate-binding [Verrucomicrobia bacterium]|nr:putative Pyruvate phosphate dikinase PEP/pyruvate-binding [Verrucomicrobiota bacterium]